MATMVMVATGQTHPICSLPETHVVGRLYVGRLSLDTPRSPSSAAASSGRYVGTTLDCAEEARFVLSGGETQYRGAVPPLASLARLLLAGGEVRLRGLLSCRHLMKRNIPLACMITPLASPHTVGAKAQVARGVKPSLFLLATLYCGGWDVFRSLLPKDISRNLPLTPGRQRASEGGRGAGHEGEATSHSESSQGFPGVLQCKKAPRDMGCVRPLTRDGHWDATTVPLKILVPIQCWLAVRAENIDPDAPGSIADMFIARGGGCACWWCLPVQVTVPEFFCL